MQDDAVLQRLSLSQDDLLGHGGESRVYALDDERILRGYQRGADRGYVDRRRAFYDRPASHDLTFHIPAATVLH